MRYSQNHLSLGHLMKKIAILLLLGSYAVATYGIGIDSHFCCGKLKSISITLIEQKDSKCTKKASSSCCNTKHQYIKVHDNHLASSGVFHFHIPMNLPYSFQNEAGNGLLLSNPIYGANSAHGPPLRCPLYILHCIYRI
jgi:hypothetical protein